MVKYALRLILIQNHVVENILRKTNIRYSFRNSESEKVESKKQEIEFVNRKELNRCAVIGLAIAIS